MINFIKEKHNNLPELLQESFWVREVQIFWVRVGQPFWVKVVLGCEPLCLEKNHCMMMTGSKPKLNVFVKKNELRSLPGDYKKAMVAFYEMTNLDTIQDWKFVSRNACR